MIWVGAASLVGGHLLYVIQDELGSLAEHPTHSLLVWMGGLSFYSGLIGGLLALVVLARRRGLPILVDFDIAAPAAAAGQAIGHLGCLTRRRLVRHPDRSAVGRHLPESGSHGAPRRPHAPDASLRTILLALLFLGLGLGRERIGRIGRIGDGAVAAAYLFGLAAIRFGLFYLREEPDALLGLKTAQLIGLGIGVLALVLFIVARQTRAPSTPLTLEGSRP